MAVPINVTADDHRRETEIVDRLVKEFGFANPKLNHDDPTATFDGEIVTPSGDKCLFELRSRNHSGESINKWGGAYINCDKFWSAIKVARNSGSKYGFFLSCDGELWGRKLYDPNWTDDDFLEFISGLAYGRPKRHNTRAGQESNDSCWAYLIKINRVA